MKKVFRKIMSIAIIIAIIFSIPVLGNDIVKEDVFDKHIFNNLEINVNLANAIKNEFNKSDKLKNISIDNIENDLYKLSTYKNHMAILLNSTFKDEILKSKIYSENFAGSFIDEELNLNICLINDIFKEKYLEFFNDKIITKFSEIAAKAVELPESYSNISEIIHINFVYCENSYGELNEIYNNLKDNLIEFGISQLYIKESDNKIYVHIKDNDIAKTVDLYLKNKKYKGSLIKYIIDDTVIKTTTTYRAYGGHKVYYSVFLGESGGTILCNAFDSDNNYGVITNAHVALSGKTMKSVDNKIIGTPSLREHTATMDAAFIPFNNTSSVTWEKTEYISETGTTVHTPISSVSDSSKFVEGARVVKYGITTGRTIGTITSINYSGSVDTDDDGIGDFAVQDLFKYSNPSLPGDSGGPVILNTGIAKSKYYLAGINTFGVGNDVTNSVGFGYRAYEVENQLGVTIITSQNILDLE